MAVARLKLQRHNGNGIRWRRQTHFDLQRDRHGGDSGTATYCRAIRIQPDGKILLAGGYKGAGTADYDFAVARLKTDGSFDTSFDLDGKRTIGFDIGVSSSNDNDFANAIDFAGNKIVVAGRATYNRRGHGHCRNTHST